MARSKFQQISKRTTLKKLNKISKSKHANRPAPRPITTRQSLRWKLEEKKKSTKIVGPLGYFGTNSTFLQSVILCHILEHNFSLFEQIQMRRVCRLWHYNVEHIWNKSRALTLTLKDHSIIKPKLSADSHEPRPKLDFDHFDAQTMMMVKGVELAIGKNHWTTATIDLMGGLFQNIEHLTIFYELSCKFDTTENLSYFLQKFKNVKSFSFIMPSWGTTQEHFMTILFEIINSHLAPLNTLHIYVPYYNEPFKFVKKEYFLKTLPYLQNFSLNCKVVNLGEMLKMMGTSLPAHFPIQSLSINIGDEKSLSPTVTLFEQNSKLSQIKRLELIEVTDRTMISHLLGHFTQLECLYLVKSPSVQSKINFSIEWIRLLSKLPYLTELHLWNFLIPMHQYWIKDSLPNIRKLTIVTSYSLHTDIQNQYDKVNMHYEKMQPPWLKDPDSDEVEPKIIYGQYLYSFARQFPNVEQLTLRHYDTFEKIFSDWCYGAFRHLKSLRLINGKKEVTFN